MEYPTKSEDTTKIDNEAQAEAVRYCRSEVAAGRDPFDLGENRHQRRVEARRERLAVRANKREEAGWARERARILAERDAGRARLQEPQGGK